MLQVVCMVVLMIDWSVATEGVETHAKIGVTAEQGEFEGESKSIPTQGLSPILGAMGGEQDMTGLQRRYVDEEGMVVSLVVPPGSQLEKDFLRSH